MKHTIHKSDTRGFANHGWLKSNHTFSFANYHNPERLNFGALRVLNDDIVAPNEGFGTHPHSNMEIISIPLEGSLKHKDSTGHESIIGVGDIQVMTAGKGIMHSEYNASNKESVNFLQIWIFPSQEGLTPRYDQQFFDEKQSKNTIYTFINPAEEGGLYINQKAWLSLCNLEKSLSINYNLHAPDNGLYLFLIEGAIQLFDISLNKRDGIEISDIQKIDIEALENSKLLFIEVPMHW